MHNILFYFNFVYEDGGHVDGPSTVYTFTVDASNSDIDFDDWNEGIFADHISDVESDFGVHDYSSGVGEKIRSIGYTSYEIAPDDQRNVMDLHRQFFIKHFGNASGISIIGEAVFEKTDDEIYELVVDANNDNAPSSV